MGSAAGGDALVVAGALRDRDGRVRAVARDRVAVASARRRARRSRAQIIPLVPAGGLFERRLVPLA